MFTWLSLFECLFGEREIANYCQAVYGLMGDRLPDYEKEQLIRIGGQYISRTGVVDCYHNATIVVF